MPSGLSSLPPVSVVPSIRPVTSILPAGQQAAASPFLAPAIAQQVKTAAALFLVIQIQIELIPDIPAQGTKQITTTMDNPVFRRIRARR